MRLVVALLLVSLLSPPAIQGQSPKPSPPSLPSASDPAINAYRLTRKDGPIYVVNSFRREKGNYIVTDLAGKVMQHRAEMVAAIEPLTADAAQQAAQGYATPGTESGPGHGARTTSRTTARKSARTTIHDLNRDIADNPAAYGAIMGGSGGGTFVGPRGGVYHYSASGGKVYERH